MSKNKQFGLLVEIYLEAGEIGLALEALEQARTAACKVAQGVYVTSGKASFLEVCGRLFHHRGIPLVPIVHVKQWPLKARTTRYTKPMELAKREVRKGLSITQYLESPHAP